VLIEEQAIPFRDMRPILNREHAAPSDLQDWKSKFHAMPGDAFLPVLPFVSEIIVNRQSAGTDDLRWRPVAGGSDMRLGLMKAEVAVEGWPMILISHDDVIQPSRFGGPAGGAQEQDKVAA